jgi:hypothetical protein
VCCSTSAPVFLGVAFKLQARLLGCDPGFVD